MSTRRSFLFRGSMAMTALALAGKARAADELGGKRFLFIHAEGGWDPLCVFAPKFGVDTIDMEPDASPWTIGGLSLVDSPQRPGVRTFFEKHHQKVLVVDGVSTRSVNHETCQAVALTGGTSDDRPDFATLLAQAQRDTRDLPHLVVSGPAFPGPYGVLVGRAEGKLQGAIDGSLLAAADDPVQALAAPAARVVDRFLVRRAAAVAARAPDNAFARDVLEAQRRAQGLIDRSSEVHFTAGVDLRGRAQTAIAALRDGVSRCASLGSDFIWDTHTDNTKQTANFERLFSDLDAILGILEETRGPGGRPLAEDTVVVVMSEMGRTPKYNGTAGRDHWPTTTMLVIGPGITGDRQIGGYSDLYTGVGVDADGERDASQPSIPAASLGATLLLLGDVDPAEVLPSAEPIPGVLS